jgi:exonuclease SbcC
MIPQQLILKNFLSYHSADIDFHGLHTACICGPNGAGKSSLLEAIAWSVWGCSRVASEDDIIHIGAKETRVDFTFISDGNTYRVIRSRKRGQSVGLEFQVAVDGKFATLSEKGVRATQQKILDAIKLDYETFVNSAYLRQGRADEFMLKRPTERKEILANLLKLDQYDQLGDKAKDLAKQFKGKTEQLEEQLERSRLKLQETGAIALEKTNLDKHLQELQVLQSKDQAKLQTLQTEANKRQTWQNLFHGQQQQYDQNTKELGRLQQDLANNQQQLNELFTIIQQADQINQGYANLQHLQTLEEGLSAKFTSQQLAEQKRQKLQEELRLSLIEKDNQIQQKQGLLVGIEQQIKDLSTGLQKKSEIEAAMNKLLQIRQNLNEWERLQLEVSPLLQQRQKLQLDIERSQSRLVARLEELQKSIEELQKNLAQQSKLVERQKTIQTEIGQLDRKKVYQERVKDKGNERHKFISNLQNQAKELEEKLGAFDQKIKLLNQLPTDGTEEYPPCPLCDRPLDEHHWHLVVNKQKTERQEISNLSWVIREQIAMSEREIQVLRDEYQHLQQEMASYEELKSESTVIQAKLELFDQQLLKLQQFTEEEKTISQSLQTGDYARDLYEQFQVIETKIASLNYDEQSHALTRTEEKNYRWAEIKLAKIKDDENKLNSLQTQCPQLATEILTLQQARQDYANNAPLQKDILALQTEIASIGYDLQEHNQVKQALKQAQSFAMRWERLQQAQIQYPLLQERVKDLQDSEQLRIQDLDTQRSHLQTLQQQIESTPAVTEDIDHLEKLIGQRNQQINQGFADLGKLQQRQQELELLGSELSKQEKELQFTQRQFRVYTELGQAFGKNGIQALMIENVLPQFEAETNQILTRLSANQLHVQFVTQKATKATSNKKTPKLIDTLDILIADPSGTRPYETYSGGEAFRINFAIRLALARLLAQRSGTALQMLIIDEGFGTQDAEGCDRLIAAINAIANDFACILTVTHIPHLKEAFQARIEVIKTPQGSQVQLSV